LELFEKSSQSQVVLKYKLLDAQKTKTNAEIKSGLLLLRGICFAFLDCPLELPFQTVSQFIRDNQSMIQSTTSKD